MIRRPILTAFVAILTFLTTATVGLVSDGNLSASFFSDIFGSKVEPVQTTILAPILRLNPEEIELSGSYVLEENVIMGKMGKWTYCDYEAPEEPEYAAEFKSLSITEDIEPGDEFEVTFEFENTGNARVFASNSGCQDVKVLNLGTQHSVDRNSTFGTVSNRVSGWLAANRVKMTEAYADPGETFHVTFVSVAPEGDNLYREWFQPVVEWVGWLDEPISVDIEVGEATEQMIDDISFAHTLSIDAASLEGLERNLEVELGTQTMHAKVGDHKVWSFTISSGAAETPTPTGTYSILNKQELRIGGAYPHYRMPYWQGWRTDGYGLHALPYLETDGGAFWQEALDHIGIPVSHGCVRQLPDEAEELYRFTDIGTSLYIHY